MSTRPFSELAAEIDADPERRARVDAIKAELEQPTRALVIDDMRVLPDRPGVEYTYARSLAEGLKQLDNGPWDEMWFDHDLGGADTIRPLVLELERRVCLENIPAESITKVCYLVTSNPVGQRWLMDGLELIWPTHIYHGEYRYDF